MPRIKSIQEALRILREDDYYQVPDDRKYRALFRNVKSPEITDKDLSIEPNPYTDYAFTNRGHVGRGKAGKDDKNAFVYLDKELDPKATSIKDGDKLKARVQPTVIAVKQNPEDNKDPYIAMYRAWGHWDLPHGGNGQPESPYNFKNEAEKKLYDETHIKVKNLRYTGNNYVYYENSAFVRLNIQKDKNWMHYYNYLFIGDWVSDDGEGVGIEKSWRWVKVSEIKDDTTCRIKDPLFKSLKDFGYIN